MAHGGMRPLASAPLAAPLPRRSEAEPFRNSRSHGRATVVLWSVSAFLLRMPGGVPAAPANVRSRPHASVCPEAIDKLFETAENFRRRWKSVGSGQGWKINLSPI